MSSLSLMRQILCLRSKYLHIYSKKAIVKSPRLLLLTASQIPAEAFPTRYRATCHRLSAASGELGSVLAQVFLAYAKFEHQDVNYPGSKWLGHILQSYVGQLNSSLTYF